MSQEQYSEPRATVREVDGELVLDDPDAVAVISALSVYEKTSNLLELNAERVEHFKRRVEELGKSPAEVVITVINVDDYLGSILAEALMPGHDWQAYRDRGELPVARGLAERNGIQGFLETAKLNAAADQLRQMDTLAVVVVECENAAIYPA